MSNLEILNKLDKIHTMIDKHEYTDKLVEVQNALSSLFSEIQDDVWKYESQASHLLNKE